ncbi:hypothetical protein ASPZODRAFT_69864 [Penicilliopsis zonata CBS 506.65]|uniref:Zn(2)-C6 fungal-type domain-containing protein n=1 Tax=Penicilliopsis zonata CBS 506.65 TaxID=1073090 RepID=A0A1L9SDP2_9EURO|nr:hypothetical protein ASPZODRAFT_69864 [Penicilliopsis zonata CBS 506.65]OJJ45233.1 hypothetical protein ASPZODRAFT_69864 [Penicilliopsis zonata CBS 506.65]
MDSSSPVLSLRARRSRVPLSCDPCRARKLKCNREKPCQNCTARNEQTNCRFKGQASKSALAGHTNGDLRARIEHLEGLVRRLAEQQPQNSITTPESQDDNEEDQSSPSAGMTVVDGLHSVYRAGDDWDDVLHEVYCVFSYAVIALSPVDGSSLLFGHVKPVERVEILSSLPSRPELDKLIAEFFAPNFPITIPPIIHEPTFMQEYDQHWKNPTNTNFIWLGLLFSILGIMMLSYHQFHEPEAYEGRSELLFQLYRIRTAQCLLAGDMAKCLPYTIETLRFNATAELNRKDDNRRGLWIMTGVIIRAAINMGYHRDAQHSSSISPLQAEYRRRVWLAVTSMDNMSSVQCGFPRSASTFYSDTKEPRNVHEWEMSDEMTVLPPSRPLTEPTQVTYLIVKGRLTNALGRIADLNNSPRVSYETVLDIDKTLHETYENFPSHMKVDKQRTNSSSSISLASMYHKGMCTLHRRFMAKSGRRGNGQFRLSRNRCIESALAILGYQEILQPTWYEFAQARQVCVLAAMILFLELELRKRFPEEKTDDHNDAFLIHALEKSCSLWRDASKSCDEAGRVYDVLMNMMSSQTSVEIPWLNEKDLSMDIDWVRSFLLFFPFFRY